MERGLELEIRRGWIFDAEFVQLVGHDTSAGVHGPAVLIPRSVIEEVIDRLQSLERFLGLATGDSGPLHGVLF